MQKHQNIIWKALLSKGDNWSDYKKFCQALCSKFHWKINYSGKLNGHSLGIIYALSCSAVKTLGFNCVRRRTKAFIGYSEEYIFLHSHIKVSRPREDKRAALFFKPSNLIPISLMKGNSAHDSHKDSKSALRRTIVDLLNSEAINEERVCLPYLIWNYQHLTLLGNGEAKL